MRHSLAGELSLAGTAIACRPDDGAGGADQYLATVCECVSAWGLHHLLPVQEEGFYLPRAAFPPGVVLAPDLEHMKVLHHKEHAMRTLKAANVEVPETHPFDPLLEPAPDARTWFVKPSLGRGGRSDEGAFGVPHVRQRRCHGTEFSSLTFFIKGKVLAHACYEPTCPMKSSAGFNCVRHRCPMGSVQHAQSLAIAVAVSNAFAEEYNGFMGFDLMEPSPGLPLVPIECNPRCTMGMGFMFTAPSIHTTYSLLGGVFTLSVPLRQGIELIRSSSSVSDEGTLRMALAISLIFIDAVVLHVIWASDLIKDELVTWPSIERNRCRPNGLLALGQVASFVISLLALHVVGDNHEVRRA